MILREYQTTREVQLTPDQRERLRAAVRGLEISPSAGLEGAYDLTPGSTIGVVELDDLSVVIQPKLAIDRLLFLISYAFDPKHWRDTPFALDERDSLVEALIPGFVFQVRRALRRGVLQGYCQREEALAGVKGRIRFDQQLRDRFGIAPPIEVTYDDFTEDILLNQLLKAAAIRILKLRLRHRGNRNDLRNLLRGLAAVSEVEFTRNLPEVIYTRLNKHYRPAVELACLILRSTSFDLGHGRVRARSFLINMNDVFEEFVIVALREALGLRQSDFPRGARGRPLFLDSERTVRLKPDLSWWVGGKPVFVGDVKYKKLDAGRFKHADLYQLLAYTVATKLDDGLVIYAAGESEPRTVVVPMAGKRLRIVTLGLQGSPELILGEVRETTKIIVELRAGSAMPLDKRGLTLSG
jgi:5-methylcytosine-specific restriction enzyme subunit McrC